MSTQAVKGTSAIGQFFGELKSGLFGTVGSTCLTVVLLTICSFTAWRIFDWAVLNAVFTGSDPAICQAVEGQGACWIFVREKARLILFGLYPYEQQWRPATCLAILIPLIFISGAQALWNRYLLVVWLAGIITSSILMWGGILGLPYVEQDRWGGLPVTLLIAVLGMGAALPIATALALARRSVRYPVFRAGAAAYVEVIRGLPLVMVLFMVGVMLPLFFPGGAGFSKMARVIVAFTIFAAAYLSEPIRGGLLSISKGQIEAADALGLSKWSTARRVLLPQALRVAIPPMVNTAISFFKATSVVSIVGVYEVLTASKVAIADRNWQGFGVEIYLFVGAIYFIFCYSLSRYSQNLESRLAVNR